MEWVMGKGFEICKAPGCYRHFTGNDFRINAVGGVIWGSVWSFVAVIKYSHWFPRSYKVNFPSSVSVLLYERVLFVLAGLRTNTSYVSVVGRLAGVPRETFSRLCYSWDIFIAWLHPTQRSWISKAYDLLRNHSRVLPLGVGRFDWVVGRGGCFVLSISNKQLPPVRSLTVGLSNTRFITGSRYRLSNTVRVSSSVGGIRKDDHADRGKSTFASITAPWDDTDSVLLFVWEMKESFTYLSQRYMPWLPNIPLYQGFRWDPTWKTLPTHNLTRRVFVERFKLDKKWQGVSLEDNIRHLSLCQSEAVTPLHTYMVDGEYSSGWDFESDCTLVGSQTCYSFDLTLIVASFSRLRLVWLIPHWLARSSRSRLSNFCELRGGTTFRIPILLATLCTFSPLVGGLARKSFSIMLS
ncbi:hypothetical protein IEQ34_024850 [Dendrobium chrysotoxum]|uniref:Uncharacterized protein n=1 Tax=Dendrobium chrysotoxum TaxID=161865 RepID=A0AAV7FRH1_DENCH|nr:hypothetical protein IEQ34_024850 [Dendrobium chrysotoxum]